MSKYLLVFSIIEAPFHITLYTGILDQKWIGVYSQKDLELYSVIE